jgi:acetolactate synthase-1/2/3 large subunit
METLMHLDNPTLDWVRIAEGHGVPATRATTAEEFHQQFEAAMRTNGPKLIDAQIVENLGPMIDAVHKARVV